MANDLGPRCLVCNGSMQYIANFEGNQRPAWGCEGTNGKADCHGWIWVDEYSSCGFTIVSASQPPKDTGVSNVADSSQGSAAPDLSQQSRPLDLVDEEPGNDYHSESSPDCTPANWRPWWPSDSSWSPDPDDIYSP